MREILGDRPIFYSSGRFETLVVKLLPLFHIFRSPTRLYLIKGQNLQEINKAIIGDFRQGY